MPTGKNESRRAQFDGSEEMPYIGEATYLVCYLAEIGNARHDGDEVHEITWGELESWSRMTRTTISAEEAFALRRLSMAIAHQSIISRDPICASPFDRQTERREIVAKKVMAAFAMLRGPKRD